MILPISRTRKRTSYATARRCL